ncbi:MAG: hypothetical protein BKP49_05420 [Treponema sp. CETP13]|nr:MAG: hypothetical protein BKP49_05420 [Treponema sp. CETP13]
MAKLNLFERLLAFFIPHDSEADKKHMLKEIAKQLNHSKFKLYKTKGDFALPSFAQFFYDIYKVIAPAQSIFLNNTNTDMFRNLIIRSQRTENQQNLLDDLNEENILKISRTVNIKKVIESTNEKLAMYMEEFTPEKIEKIDNTYNKLMMFIDFCNFDYYFLLKKSDSNIPERDFKYRPKFEPIRGEYITEDLQNFVAIAWAMPLEENWSDVFKFLNEYKNFNVINIQQWNKITHKLSLVQKENVFEQIIQLALKDPSYTIKTIPTNEHIVESQLEKIKKSIHQILHKIESQQKTEKSAILIKDVFGNSVPELLKNYNENSNLPFIKHGLNRYTHTQELNFLKVFLIEFCKKDMREFSDLVLVRGEWASASLANPMSEAYHSLLNISDRITDFDKSLAEDNEIGTKLKNYTIRADRDHEAHNIANNLISSANDTSFELLKLSTQFIIEYGRNLKSLIEDYDKKRSELIVNWKELEKFSQEPIKAYGIEIYKKLYSFVSLLKLFLQD